MVACWFRTRWEHELWKRTSICIAVLGIWWIVVYVSLVMWRLDPMPWWPFCVGGGLTVLAPALGVPFVACVAYLDRRDDRRRDRSGALEDGNKASSGHILVMEARTLAATVPIDAPSTAQLAAASDSATG